MFATNHGTELLTPRKDVARLMPPTSATLIQSIITTLASRKFLQANLSMGKLCSCLLTSIYCRLLYALILS